MQKELSEMSLEELYQLFPIMLTKPNPEWETWYQDESGILHRILSNVELVGISHIGSTAIKGIWAKPTVDILIEVRKHKDFAQVQKILIANGYLLMCQEENRMSFNKGYTKYGFAERVFHIHVVVAGNHDEIYFRDYLNAHPQIAREYEALKLSLKEQYEHDRDGYTKAKTEFVKKYTEIAKENN